MVAEVFWRLRNAGLENSLYCVCVSVCDTGSALYSKNQGSISPMFYKHLLHTRSHKCKKYSQVVSLFALLGSARIKAARKMLIKLTPGYAPHPAQIILSSWKKLSWSIKTILIYISAALLGGSLCSSKWNSVVTVTLKSLSRKCNWKQKANTIYFNRKNRFIILQSVASIGFLLLDMLRSVLERCKVEWTRDATSITYLPLIFKHKKYFCRKVSPFFEILD